MFIFLTDILKKKVLSAFSQKALGRPWDLLAGVDEVFPPVIGILLKARGRRGPVFIPWEKVQEKPGEHIRVTVDALEELPGAIPTGSMIHLRRDVLDRQIIDTFGARVVRVNDLHLLRMNGDLRLVHVDVGMSGILRRLGWTRGVNFLTHGLFDYTLKDHLISWRFVQPLGLSESDSPRQVLQLSAKQPPLSQLHPADLADILEDLDAHKREAIFRALNPEVAADVLGQMETKLQVDLIEGMKHEQASRLIEEMAADEAADLLGELEDEKTEAILGGMEKERSGEVRELLSHDEDTAGGLMTTDFIGLKKGYTVDETIAVLRREAPEAESISYLYVVDDEELLVGVVTLRSLIVAHPERKLEDLMSTRVISVTVDEDKQEVAEIFSKYRFRALPVLDGNGVMKGIITLDDIVEAVAPDFGK